jgi:bacterioferritin-associated ferredoxin
VQLSITISLTAICARYLPLLSSVVQQSYIRPNCKNSKKRARTESSPPPSEESYIAPKSYAIELALRQAEIDRAVGLGQGCRHCVRAANLLHLHEQLCSTANCAVPYCANLKQVLRKES